ncbi:MAG TPA: Hpt domain-containing protein [Bacteroidales bacterium]|nr:Hpt domain-containing protein [Bacteroidales bacterium]HPF02860.1 Hpt domain-containing protein [Bacteroidales bacterium]HPJ58421.1 Hpt domain-containing protein [Bacteroidales bacterium]HPR10773.1 Hpt domain-containing protein [Bacteroidales bacterium]HRW86064.1 Hpt domain-containing protein [Bacteroidales bacterium]
MTYKYINTEYLDSVSGGDYSVTIEIVSMFIEQAGEIFSEMKTLLENKDYYNLGLLAHKAKSSVAIMGMADLAAMLKTFELQAKEGVETEKYGSYVDRYRIETTEAAAELNDLVENIKKGV